MVVSQEKKWMKSTIVMSWMRSSMVVSCSRSQDPDSIFIALKALEARKLSMGKPSDQELENTFGTTDGLTIVRKILKDGTLKGTGHEKNRTAIKNNTRGSTVIDTRGHSLTGI